MHCVYRRLDELRCRDDPVFFFLRRVAIFISICHFVVDVPLL
jgi:hypothetical protein